MGSTIWLRKRASTVGASSGGAEQVSHMWRVVTFKDSKMAALLTSTSTAAPAASIVLTAACACKAKLSGLDSN